MATAASKKDCYLRLHENIPKIRNNASNGPRKVAIPSDPSLESVYSLIPNEYIPPIQEKRYQSKYAAQARMEYTDTQKEASMGPAKVLVPPTNQFLKKGHGVPKVQIKTEKTEKIQSTRKAPLPISCKIGQPIPATTKDFIKQNALDNINSLPKRLNNPKTSYLVKKDYGKTPDYLKTRITQLQEQNENKATYLAMEKTQRDNNNLLQDKGIVVLPDDEREKILAGLRDNWDKLNHDYQRLSLTVDTVPKIARKVNMEQQLKQYEELIDRFSHTTIHVNFNS